MPSLGRACMCNVLLENWISTYPWERAVKFYGRARHRFEARVCAVGWQKKRIFHRVSPAQALHKRLNYLIKTVKRQMRENMPLRPTLEQIVSIPTPGTWKCWLTSGSYDFADSCFFYFLVLCKLMKAETLQAYWSISMNEPQFLNLQSTQQIWAHHWWTKDLIYPALPTADSC